MSTATSIQVKYYKAGVTYHDWATSGVTVVAGYGYSGQNWVTCIKFTTASYTKALVVKLTSGGVRGAYTTLNYKLCTSEDSSYINATSATASDGTITLSKYDYTPTTHTLNTGYIAPGTYYLYLWTSMSTSYNCYSAICHNGNGYVSISYTEATPLSTLTASNGTLGTAQTLTITRYDSSFTHSIRYDCGDTSAAIVTKTSSTSVSFTPSLNLARENTTGTSVSITFTLYTFDGDTEVGTTQTTITCAMPASIAPVASLSVSDILGYADTYGGYIQSKSRLEIIATASYVNSNYETTITGYKITADGKTYNYSDVETTPLVNSGTLTISATITDARGRTGTVSKSITVLPYTSPAISKLAVHRCDSDGTENATGSYCKVTYSFSITSLSNTNGKTINLLYKKTSDTSYTTVALTSAYSATDATYIFAADDASSYNVQLQVSDAFGTTTKSTTVSTAAVLMHWGADGKAIAFGKISEKSEAIEFGWTPYDSVGAMMGNGLAAYTGGGDSGIDPNTTLEELCLTSHTNAPQGLGTFYYIRTSFYNVKSATAARAQIAWPYNKTGSIYHRYYASGAWSAWARFMTSTEAGTVYAPAGYGLGHAKRITADALDTTVAPGFYDLSQSMTIGNITATYWRMFVTAYGSGSAHCTQYICCAGLQGYEMRRVQSTSGTWSEWENINPPLTVGVEYRTAERYQGKAVYTKLVSLGTLPNATTKTVAHSASASAVIRVAGVTSTGTTLPYRSSDSVGEISATTTNIVVYYNYNASTATGIARMWYTKD